MRQEIMKDMNLQNADIIVRDIFSYIVDNKDKSAATVVLLRGDLGAGKTFVSKKIAALLGVQEEVVSPTFVIMKSYSTQNKDFKKFVHADMYRLEASEESKPLHLEEIYKEKDTLFFIEWPENIQGVLPDGAIYIYIEHKEGEERMVRIK